MRSFMHAGLLAMLLALPAHAITVAATGDIMLGSAFPFASELPPADGRNVLGAAQPQLAGADVVFGNLEGVLIDDVSLVRPCPELSTTCFRFGMPARYGSHLRSAGFNVVNLANNHMNDFDEQGRQIGFDNAQAHGLVAFGIETSPTATQVLDSGLRIGWVGYAPHTGVNRPTVETIRQQVADLKKTHDLVFVSMHVGGEGAAAQRVTRATEMFLGQNRGNPYAFAHAAIDAGADLVIGHGPHVLRGLELYKGRLIAYSLGNFATYGRFNLKGVNGLTGVLRVTLRPDGEFVEGHFVSMKQDRTSEAWAQGVGPVLDPTGEAWDVLRQLSREDFPESPLLFDANGRLTRSEPLPEPQPLPVSLHRAAPAPVKAQPITRTVTTPRPTRSGWQTVKYTLHTYYTRSRNAIRQLADN